MVKCFISLVFAAFSIALFADYGVSCQYTLWRGETSYFKLPDNSSYAMKSYFADSPRSKNGVSVEFRTVGAVPYTSTIAGNQLSLSLDLVKGEDCNFAPWSICKITVDKDAKPGTVDFGPLKVNILDRVLPPPAEWKYFLDIWQHPWAVARYFGVKPFSDEHFARMDKVYKTFAECGVKSLTVTLLDYPWNHQCYDPYLTMIGRVKNDDGSWSFDYSLFDKYVEFGRKCGIGPDIACYTMCPWGYVVRWKDSKGQNKSMKAYPGTKEFEDYWGDFLVDFAKHLKEKGWFDDVYIAMDERSPRDIDLIAKFVRSKAPGLKIAMAGNRNPADFKGIVIDNYSQGLHHITSEFLEEVASRRKQGLKTSFYVCCSPARPNTFMSSSEGEAFWIGMYPALCGMDGFLRWAANSWPFNPYANAAFGWWKAGDSFLVYPEGEYSLRLLNLRSGIVVAEKLRILREQGKYEKETAELAERYHFNKAKDGKVDYNRCRRDLEKLVNR